MNEVRLGVVHKIRLFYQYFKIKQVEYHTMNSCIMHLDGILKTTYVVLEKLAEVVYYITVVGISRNTTLKINLRSSALNT